MSSRALERASELPLQQRNDRIPFFEYEQQFVTVLYYREWTKRGDETASTWVSIPCAKTFCAAGERTNYISSAHSDTHVE